VNPRIRWSQAPASWEAPGWAPLVDHGPLPLQTARSVGRWLWPALSIGGFLVVVSFVFGNDDPTPGLSLRGLLTIALAAAVMVLLTLRRTAGPGPLTRALFEYAVVFLLAVLNASWEFMLHGRVPLRQVAAGRARTGCRSATAPGRG
jgi:peptidoglycan/LPS O-acetylase OafA/YrhL